MNNVILYYTDSSLSYTAIPGNPVVDVVSSFVIKHLLSQVKEVLEWRAGDKDERPT